MQGDTEGAYYSANKTILEGLKPTFESNSGSCTLGEVEGVGFSSYCDAGDFTVSSDSEGYVVASDYSSLASCSVNSGFAGCVE